MGTRDDLGSELPGVGAGNARELGLLAITLNILAIRCAGILRAAFTSNAIGASRGYLKIRMHHGIALPSARDAGAGLRDVVGG